MADPTPTPGKYKRDVGSGDQLASGDATQGNADLVAGNAIEEQLAQQDLVGTPQPEPAAVQDAPPGPVQYDTGTPDYQPKGELEQILFGPAEGLKPEPTTDQLPVPDSVVRALPRMSLLVQDPSTPAVIKAAYKYIIRKLEAEQRANG